MQRSWFPRNEKSIENGIHSSQGSFHIGYINQKHRCPAGNWNRITKGRVSLQTNFYLIFY